MKTLILCCLCLLAISATAQRSSIGLGAGGGYDRTPIDPHTGLPFGVIPQPNDVQTLKGEVRDTRNNLLLLQVRRYQDGHFAEVLILVTNFPGLDKLTSDQSVSTYGKRTGIARDGDGDKHELYEYFNLNAYRDKIEAQAEADARDKAEARRAANQAAAEQGKARALKVNQDAAAKGDMFGLLRMGERYRDGDGVEKDLGKAREYLQKAADAGSPTAKEELSNLKQ